MSKIFGNANKLSFSLKLICLTNCFYCFYKISTIAHKPYTIEVLMTKWEINNSLDSSFFNSSWCSCKVCNRGATMTAQVHLGHFPWSNHPDMNWTFCYPMKIWLIMNFYQKCAILLLILVHITHICNVLLIVLNMWIYIFYIRLLPR